MATLTYDYDDGMAVLGPLSPERAADGYDLCPTHVDRLRIPQGWRLVRYAPVPEAEVGA